MLASACVRSQILGTRLSPNPVAWTGGVAKGGDTPDGPSCRRRRYPVYGQWHHRMALAYARTQDLCKTFSFRHDPQSFSVDGESPIIIYLELMLGDDS